MSLSFLSYNQKRNFRKFKFFFYLIKLKRSLKKHKGINLSQNEHYIITEFLYNHKYIHNLSEKELDYFDNLLVHSTKDRRISNLNFSSYSSYREDIYFYAIKNPVNKKRLKESITADNIIFQNLSHLQLDIFKLSITPDYYIMREKISCYSEDPEYDFLSYHLTHFVHKDNVESFIKEFEKDRLEYLPDIQKIVDKIQDF